MFHEESETGTAFLAVHPFDAWEKLTADMAEWYDMVDEDELEETEIDWLEDGVSFAEVPSSGNYFVLARSGVHKGKVLYADHDGLEAEVYAESFNEFLIKFLSSPAEQIEHLGCYTRYSDGKTNRQWIPVESV
jgi:hypothetical protein